MVRCDKWDGPKVCWKFIDPPRYDDGLMIKSSVSMFLVHLLQEKRVTACHEYILGTELRSSGVRAIP